MYIYQKYIVLIPQIRSRFSKYKKNKYLRLQALKLFVMLGIDGWNGSVLLDMYDDRNYI